MKLPLLLLATLLVLANLLSASVDEINLVYRVAGKEYLITEFKEGIPNLDEDAVASDLLLKGEDGVAWNWTGELPVNLEYAFPFAGYRIVIEPKRYGEMSSRIWVSLDLYQKEKSVLWNEEDVADGFFVYGWVINGEVTKIVVSRAASERNYDKSLSFALNAEEMSGYPLLWLVRDGRLVAKPSVEPYEQFALVDSNADEFPNAKIKKAGKQGDTALHFAALNGNVEGVKWLLENKANTKVTNEYGEIPLMSAAKTGRLDTAALLFNRSAAYEARSGNWMTALELAVAQGHFDVVQVLVPGDAKKKKEEDAFANALISAVRLGHEDIAVYLMDRKAKPKLADKSKLEAYLFGLYANGFPSLGRTMVSYFEGESVYQREGTTVMHAVASYADSELFNEIKGLGVSVSSANEKGITPLDIAIAFGNVEAICWFIDNGGNLGSGTNGLDPVLRAVGLGQNESLQCLISYGYDVNKFDSVGLTPLMRAVLMGNMSIAETLVDAGGAWLTDHQYFDRCIAKIIELDAPSLLRSLDGFAWPLTSKLFDTWTLRDVALFYDSQETLAFLESQALEFPDTKTYSGSVLDQKLQVLGLGSVPFSDDMQRKYGSVDVLIEVMADAKGQVRFVRFKGDVADDLRAAVANGIMNGSYKAAVLSGKDVASRLSLKLPLRVSLKNKIAFEINALDVRPAPISQMAPRYPYLLKQQSIPGWVDLEWIILGDGTVAHVTAVRYSHESFAESSIEAIKQSRWKPGEVDGKPVNTRVTQRITFTP